MTIKTPYVRLNHNESEELTRDQHAYIALGSNMDGRLKPIEQACRDINSLPDTKIVKLSHLWNTKAEYVENQADFLNGVCEVRRRPLSDCLLIKFR
jgi:2-amino-4-hydroxy-6-hydroxymethyldihydropteridine diphosphokinase